MKLGIDAVGEAGGIVEAAVCYTGDVSDRERGLYDLKYYLGFVCELEARGIHVLAIKGEFWRCRRIVDILTIAWIVPQLGLPLAWSRLELPQNHLGLEMLGVALELPWPGLVQCLGSEWPWLGIIWSCLRVALARRDIGLKPLGAVSESRWSGLV